MPSLYRRIRMWVPLLAGYPLGAAVQFCTGVQATRGTRYIKLKHALESDYFRDRV